MNSGGRDDDGDHEDSAKESFVALAGEDGELDAFELQNILNSVFQRGNVDAIVPISCNMVGCKLR